MLQFLFLFVTTPVAARDGNLAFQVLLDGEWNAVCCNQEGEPPKVSTDKSCFDHKWTEKNRVLKDEKTNLLFKCPENNQQPTKCTCVTNGGERMHGAPAGPVSSSLDLPGGAPIFPNIGRETCSFVTDAKTIKTRAGTPCCGNKVWEKNQNSWPDKQCPYFRLAPGTGSPGGNTVTLSGDVGNGAVNIARCMGDCDTNEQCAAGLYCFQRDGFTAVPGCEGQGVKNQDYCTTITDCPGATACACTGVCGWSSKTGKCTAGKATSCNECAEQAGCDAAPSQSKSPPTPYPWNGIDHKKQSTRMVTDADGSSEAADSDDVIEQSVSACISFGWVGHVLVALTGLFLTR